jgi:cell division protein FtsB
MRPVLLLPLLVLAAVGIAFTDEQAGLRAWWALHTDVQTTRERVERLEDANAALRSEAKALAGDRFAEERAIREDLGLALPGETVVIFDEAEDPDSAR